MLSDLDRPYGTRFTAVFGDMRSAVRSYQLIRAERNNTLIISPAAALEATYLIARGNQLGNRAQALSVAWRDSNASIYDTKVTTDSDAVLRTWVSFTPLAAGQEHVPDVTSVARDILDTFVRPATGGSTTGADPLAPPPQQQGLPPWVAPVMGVVLVGGILVILSRT